MFWRNHDKLFNNSSRSDLNVLKCLRCVLHYKDRVLPCCVCLSYACHSQMQHNPTITPSTPHPPIPNPTSPTHPTPSHTKMQWPCFLCFFCFFCCFFFVVFFLFQINTNVNINTCHTMADSSDDTVDIFLTFPRKLDLKLHANYLSPRHC